MKISVLSWRSAPHATRLGFVKVTWPELDLFAEIAVHKIISADHRTKVWLEMPHHDLYFTQPVHTAIEAEVSKQLGADRPGFGKA